MAAAPSAATLFRDRYGIAEYRDESGTRYAARVARVREGWPALQQKLASLVDAGQARIRITRAG